MKLESDFCRMTAGWRDYWRSYCAMIGFIGVFAFMEVRFGPIHPWQYFFATLLLINTVIQDTRSAMSVRFRHLIELVDGEPNQSPEPTSPPVTSPAGQEPRQP